MTTATAEQITFAGEAMRPLQFGEPGRELFGCLHLPEGRSPRGTGIVICPPVGHEYTRAHRAFRVGAQRLARAGFPVFRFDLTGCGDSFGDASDAGVDRWLADTRQAIEQTASHCGTIVVLGRRLGGTLGLLASRDDPRVEGIVLWDPVIRGSDYLRELRALHDHFTAQYHGTVSVPLEDPNAARVGDVELLGQRFPDSLLSDLEQLDLLASTAPTDSKLSVRRSLVIDTATSPSQQALQAHFESLGVAIESEHAPDPDAWQIDDLLKQVVPNEVLGRISRWLEEGYPE